MNQANRWVMLLASLMTIGIAPLAIATTAEVCVSNTSELNTALLEAEVVPVTIDLVQGSYDLGNTPWKGGFDASIAILGGSSLRGGYITDCAARNIGLGNTVLNGSAHDDIGVYPLGDLTLEGLTFRLHGNFDIDVAQFDQSGHTIAPSSQIIISRSAFMGSDSGIVPLRVLWQVPEELGGYVRIVDTLIAGNTSNSSYSHCVVLLQVEEGKPYFTMINNTIVDNIGRGVCLQNQFFGSDAGNGHLRAYNNIFYGNSSFDVFSDSNELLLVDNTIGTNSYPTQLTPSAGTLNGDPELGSNYRPIESPVSPSIDSGTNNVTGGLPAKDLEGSSRVIGSMVDRGAYESNINDSIAQTVTNTNDSGIGSLRQAILNANAGSGLNLISFDIGSSCGPHVITLASPLPSITGDLWIAGYSQTGSATNTLNLGDDAVICVILSSGDASASTGLRIGPSASSSASLVVEGLAFSGFSYAALDLKGGSGHVVHGNHFGGSVGGVNLTANHVNVWIGTGVSGATIGGDDVSQRNIISGARRDITGAMGTGIQLEVPSSSQLGANNNQIINNYIGTTHTGNAAFANETGIYIGGDHNTVLHNLIAGNTLEGVYMNGTGAHNNVIEANNIGNYNSNNVLGNGDCGVWIDGARDNTIVSNTVANNGFEGVCITTGVHNRISKNSILLNGGLGIDLAGEGVTANDDDSAIHLIDYANDGLNFPVLTQATGTALSGSVGGTLTTVAGTYSVDLFVSDDCNASGHGEGAIWRRTFPVTIPDLLFGGQGTAAFTISVTPGLADTLLGKVVTATASSSTGDTSEFSACMPYTDDTLFANGFEGVP